MRGKMNFEYLGMNSFQGRKDPTKTYYSVNLLQGSEVVKVFLGEGQDVLFTRLNKMDEIECELDIRLGEKTYVSVASVILIDHPGTAKGKATA